MIEGKDILDALKEMDADIRGINTSADELARRLNENPKMTIGEELQIRQAHLFFMNLPSGVQQLKAHIWHQEKVIKHLMKPLALQTKMKWDVCTLCAKKFDEIKKADG